MPHDYSKARGDMDGVDGAAVAVCSCGAFQHIPSRAHCQLFLSNGKSGKGSGNAYNRNHSPEHSLHLLQSCQVHLEAHGCGLCAQKSGH